VPTSAWDQFLVSVGQDTYKQMIPRLDAAYQRVITLNTAMIGGTIYFVGADQLNHAFRLASMILFFASLGCALVGGRIFNEMVPLNEARAIEDFHRRVTESRYRWLGFSYWLLFSGLAVAALGVVCRLFA
jgi:hypothetical protein